jgi:hypothetical protein
MICDRGLPAVWLLSGALHPCRPQWKTAAVAHEIHIKTVDGGIVYTDAFSYGRNDGDLWVQVGDDLDHSDTIYFASGYWQQYVVDPHSEDPLDLIVEDEDEEEDDEEYEDEDYEEAEDYEATEGEAE